MNNPITPGDEQLEGNIGKLISSMGPRLAMPESSKARVLSALLRSAEAARPVNETQATSDWLASTQDPARPTVRLVPDVPTELADGVSRETCPIEQPPSRRHMRRRFVAMVQHKSVRWWIAAAVAATILLVVGLWPGEAGGGPGVAFAEVMQQICSARTVTYDMTSERPSRPAVHSRVMHLGPGRMRTENSDGTMIVDSSAHKSLVLLPATGKAIRYEFAGGPQASPEAGVFEHLLQLRGKTSEDLGQKDIDGRSATGFRVQEAGFDWAIWVDPVTGEPIRIELTSDAILGAGTRIVMHDFAFDVPLDESLFSLDPPPGYTLDVQQVNLPASPEQALIDALRECADVYEGRFPQKFDKHCTEDLEEKINPKEHPARAMQFARRFGRIFGGLMFVQALPAGSDWHYVGGGVELGQAEMPICWWKPAGSRTYRIVFGDLSVQDLDKAEVDRLAAQMTQDNPGE